MRPRQELEPADVTAICDSRERLPLDLDPLKALRGSLATGDYSVAGLELEVAVERKSLQDLVMCCGAERDRFEACVQRLLAYPSRLLLIEATWGSIELGGWRGKMTPAAVQASLLSWQARGLPTLLVGDHGAAGRACARFLFLAARQRWRVLRSFIPTLKIAGETHGVAKGPVRTKGGAESQGDPQRGEGARDTQGAPGLRGNASA